MLMLIWGPFHKKKIIWSKKKSRMELPNNSSKSKLTTRKFLLHFFIVVRPHFMWVVVCLALVAYTAKLSPQLSDGLQEFSFPLFSLYSGLSSFNPFFVRGEIESF